MWDTMLDSARSRSSLTRGMSPSPEALHDELSEVITPRTVERDTRRSRETLMHSPLSSSLASPTDVQSQSIDDSCRSFPSFVYPLKLNALSREIHSR